MAIIKMSVFDNDCSVQAETDMEFNYSQNQSFKKFINQLAQELVTGQTVYLQIEGVRNNPITFEIAQAS